LNSFGFLLSPSGEAMFSGTAAERLGDLTISGRVRLDAREDLRAQIPTAGAAASDLALCLHAYAKWGESFIDRIAGDFGFVVWDDQQRRALAVRDRLGLYPLFHAATAGGAVYVSDTIEWIVSHADVPRVLDDVWIGDLLTVGMTIDFDRTVYRDVHRLRPAHLLTVSAEGRRTLRRYWELEIGDPVHFADRRRYAERFVELVNLAVKDRLPPGSGRIGISMSGGLDSTTLAACAVAVTGDPSRVVAECYHYESLAADEEAHFSALVARKLGIELHLRAAGDAFYDPLWRTRGVRTDEPTVAIVQAHHGAQLAGTAAREAGVWLYGEGPDNALTFDRDPYFSWLRSRGDWRGLVRAAFDYVKVKGVSGWRETLARRFERSRPPGGPVFTAPSWLNPDFERRMHLRERLTDVGKHDRSAHPWHPRAVSSFKDPIWPTLFDDLRLGAESGPFEWRHPYLDLRVLEYMISLPPVPWAWQKHIVREAMRGRLPDEVLRRKKTPLKGQPQRRAMSRHDFPPLSDNDALDEYVLRGALPSKADMPSHTDSVIAVHALDYWLTQG
jgi:asparagine synthase (glutamine-hydrolysing)